MGAVYLAEDLKLRRRQVAIKVLRPEVRAALGDERFDQEVDVACHLSHPNIVPLFEAGEIDGLAFYVMGHVEGESLQERIQREGPLSLSEALQITREVGDALEYAHSHGIIHRDIKPANILLAGGHALITDFGIAKNTSVDRMLSSTGMAVGTPSYMSPEQASADKRLDRRTDVYSLAVVLYEMLSGEPPFTGRDAHAIIARLLVESPRSLRTTRSTIPLHVEKAVLAALGKTPADRPATVKAFLERLSKPPLGSVMSRRTVLVVGVTGLLVAAGGSMLWYRFGTVGMRANREPNSIGVLYFDNVGNDTADAYLADGLTEELITALGHNEQLQVKSRHSVRAYRGVATPDPILLGKSLGVAHLLSGSVRRGTTHVRVNVELTRTATGMRLWGESYDIPSTDPLEVQQQVAIAVTEKLVGRLSSIDRAAMAAFPTKSPQAYEYFLRGLSDMGPRDQRGLARALEHFEAAVRLDSSFARAYARIGITCVLIVYRDEKSVRAAPFLARGAAAIDRALQLDSTIADAWLGRGRLIAIQRGPSDEDVRTSYVRAIALDPTNTDARQFYATNLLNVFSDAEAALAQLHEAVALEPDRLNTLNSLGFAELVARRAPEALRWWDSVIVLQPVGSAPALIAAHVNRVSTRLAVLKDTMGAQQDAEAIARLGNPGASHTVLTLLELRRGHPVSARAHFQQAWTMAGWSETLCGPFEAIALIELGEHERAVDCIEHIDRDDFLFVFPYLHSPFFDPIRNHPRFKKALDRLRPPRSRSAPT